MSLPCLLFVHESDDVRARAVAAFAGLPVRLVPVHDLAAAGRLAPGGIRMLVADVGVARAAADVAARLRAEGEGEALPALVLITPMAGEPQALQAGAAALMTHPPSPDEAVLIAELAGNESGLSSLALAARDAAGRGGASARDRLDGLIARGSGAVLAWAQYHAAALLLNEGKLQEALEDLSALVDEQPAFWRAHERLAAVWDVAGDPEAATRHRGISGDLQGQLARASDASLAAHPEAHAIARAEEGDAARPDAGGAEPQAGPSSEAAAADETSFAWSGDSTTTQDLAAPDAPAAEPAAATSIAASASAPVTAPLTETAAAPVTEAAPAAPSAPARPTPAPAARGADIIVADDSELVREMLADVLERAGFSVRLAADGSEAIALARKQRPDLMILDGLMPGKTGFDACKEVKEVLYPSSPPRVLIFSAIYTKMRQRQDAVALYKVDEVLAKPSGKPLDEGELLAAIRRQLAR